MGTSPLHSSRENKAPEGIIVSSNRSPRTSQQPKMSSYIDSCACSGVRKEMIWAYFHCIVWEKKAGPKMDLSRPLKSSLTPPPPRAPPGAFILIFKMRMFLLLTLTRNKAPKWTFLVLFFRLLFGRKSRHSLLLYSLICIFRFSKPIYAYIWSTLLLIYLFYIISYIHILKMLQVQKGHSCVEVTWVEPVYNDMRGVYSREIIRQTRDRVWWRKFE